MSIEQAIADQTAAIKANTAALERLIAMQGNVTPVASVTGAAAPQPPAAPVAPAPQAQAATAPAATAPPAAPSANAPAAPAPATEVPAAPAAGAVQMTDEEMDAALIAEVGRLGGGESAVAQVRSVMGQMGLATVAGISADQQQQLLTALKILQPEA